MEEIKYINFKDLIKQYELYLEIIKREYLNLLKNLSKVENLLNYKFIDLINDIFEMGIIYIAYIIPDNNILNLKILGSGTVIYEPKIIRGGKSVARIEDIVVLTEYRGLGIAKNIINYLISFSKNRSKEDREKYKNNKIINYEVYKIILVCSDEYINFYKKFGFTEKDHNLVLYF
jgi:GNAT superfamily N-acetyltransferase